MIINFFIPVVGPMRYFISIASIWRQRNVVIADNFHLTKCFVESQSLSKSAGERVVARHISVDLSRIMNRDMATRNTMFEDGCLNELSARMINSLSVEQRGKPMAQHEKITSKAARDHTDVYHNRM
jgi:hypothetical protein